MALTSDQFASTFPNPRLMPEGSPGIAFPDFSGYSASIYRPVRRTEFQSNVISVRPRIGAVARRGYALSWNSMPDADYATLLAHWNAHWGLRFVFFPPEILMASDPQDWTEAEKEANAVFCVYADDSLDARIVNHAPRWKVSLTLWEAIDNPILEAGL